MRVYKVVRKVEGRLVSAVASAAGPGVKVIYKIGGWVSAPRWLRREGYHILAFHSIEDAKEWIEGMHPVLADGLEIWEARGEGIINPRKRAIPIWFLKVGLMDERYGFEWPIGTVMCKRVKLIKKVWPGEENESL